MAAITDLAAASSVAATDLLVISQSGTDRKVTADKFSAFTTGTFTPTMTCGTSGTITLSTSHDTMTYVKVGRLVTICGQIQVASVSSPVGTLLLGNMPFALTVAPEGADFTSGSCYNYGTTADLMIVRWGLGDDRPNILYWTGTAWAAAAGRVEANEGFIISFSYLTD
jgi:hypothetical protein